MLAKVTSYAVIGLEGVLVEVEGITSWGLRTLTIVGLPDAAVQESRERDRSTTPLTALCSGENSPWMEPCATLTAYSR